MGRDPFGDMAHVVYVNGEIEDDTELGRLMHDFHCTNASDMYYSVLARRVRYFKETQKGKDDMCAIVEEYANELFDEKAKTALTNGFMNGLTKKSGTCNVSED